jgi:hypothetical protein
MLVQHFTFPPVKIDILLFWVIILYSLADECGHLGETYCLVLPKQRVYQSINNQ